MSRRFCNWFSPYALKRPTTVDLDVDADKQQSCTQSGSVATVSFHAEVVSECIIDTRT